MVNVPRACQAHHFELSIVITTMSYIIHVSMSSYHIQPSKPLHISGGMSENYIVVTGGRAVSEYHHTKSYILEQ